MLVFTCVLDLCLFFFFSSRRRHTRCLSDWSSDVCSSDLWFGVAVTRMPFLGAKAAMDSVLSTERMNCRRSTSHTSIRLARSEERRVGKECRRRWSRYQYNKKTRGAHRGECPARHDDMETT